VRVSMFYSTTFFYGKMQTIKNVPISVGNELLRDVSYNTHKMEDMAFVPYASVVSTRSDISQAVGVLS